MEQSINNKINTQEENTTMSNPEAVTVAANVTDEAAAATVTERTTIEQNGCPTK